MISNRLAGALRQYRHNNKDGFVFGYDINDADKIINELISENVALNNLIAECTDCGELDGRLINSYMEWFLNSKNSVE